MDTTHLFYFCMNYVFGNFHSEFALCTLYPKAFTYTSQNPKSKQLIRKILITKPIREYRRQLKISILFSTLGLIVMWIGIILFAFKFVIVSLFLLAIASPQHHIFLSRLSLLTMNISTGQEQKKKEFGTLPHKSRIKLMTCRTMCVR